LTQWIFYGYPRGALAIDWKLLSDRWVFQLREGVRFHDGSPLKMTDVMWSYEQYLRQTPHMSHVEGVEVLDRNFLQIRLKAPCRLEEAPMPFILPEGATGWIGTGPFQVVELNPGFWRLKRNPYYFVHQPFFQEVHIRQYESPHALEAALASGSVHFAIGVSRPEKGFIVKTESESLRYHLHFMLNEPLMQNPLLRKAIVMGLDREALARAAGLKMPLYSSGPFDYILSNREEKPAPPDVEMAQMLMSQIEGIRNAVFRVKAFPTVPQSRSIAEAVVAQFQRLGLKAEIGESAHAVIVVRPVGQLDYEYGMWTTGDRRNINGYSNPIVDQRIQQFRNSAATNADLLELRGLIQRDAPDIPLFYYEIPMTYVDTLRALENHIIFLSGLNDIHNWYLDQPLEAQVSEESREAAAPAD
jgi:peptide/nickel transport system substrate-binding protein